MADRSEIERALKIAINALHSVVGDVDAERPEKGAISIVYAMKHVAYFIERCSFEFTCQKEQEERHEDE